MAPTSTALTTKPQSGTPYQLDPNQTLRAAQALLKHISTEAKRTEGQSTKRNLLANDNTGSDEDAAEEDEVPIWLSVTTKKHITDQKRLKPKAIPIPHSLHTSPTSRICLITASPQRTYKDLTAHPSFPITLSARINRVIDISKLKSKYKSYESRRQLFGEYDIFLADDRVITFLPKVLGKVFYGTTAKRPIPVSLTGNAKPPPKNAEGRRPVEKRQDSKGRPLPGGVGLVGEPKDVAGEIEKTLSAALVHLSPSTTTAVRVGFASWTPEKVVQNVEAVVEGLVKIIPKGMRGVRAIHIKGPNTMALPVWLADELWEDEADVLEKKWAPKEAEPKMIEGAKEKKSKKRKSMDAVEEVEAEKPKKKSKQSGDDDLVKEIALRKEKLKKQKADAIVEAGAVQPADGVKVKKSKKSKAAVAA
ncbi:proteasome-interacting protein cic1 [Coniosporium apollinis]|uniref:Proteasome-interacting protein cic1 n=1 Tax=Coniosporium apollinis TaxID=61459 RepID=A0ABQ9NYU2_9PEZI|nr:proteasome-interacting protein cic1 [Coniosporium apollinis]